MISVRYFKANTDPVNHKNTVLLDTSSNRDRFFANTFYILTEGTMVGYFSGTKLFEVSADYDSTYQDYKDIWIHNLDFDSVFINDNGKFAAITPDVPSLCKVVKLENNSISIETKDNSSIIVFGEHSYNGSNTTNLSSVTRSTNSGIQSISTNATCHVVYIEPK